MSHPAAGSTALESTLLDALPVEVPPQRRVVIFLLLLLAGLLHVLTMGWGPIENGEEGWTAAVARQLALGQKPASISENWGVRVRPTVAAWITEQSFRRFGINEMAARLPSALAVVGICWLVYLLAERQGGIARGMLAGVMVVTTTGPLLYGKLAGGASIYVLWMVAAFYCLSRLLEQNAARRKWLALFWLTLTLAVLCQGWSALLLPVATIFLLLLLFRPARLRLKIFASWLGLLLAISSAVIVLVYRRSGGDFAPRLPAELHAGAVAGLFFPWAFILLPPALFCLRRVLRYREMECNEALVWLWLVLGFIWLLLDRQPGAWGVSVALLWPALALAGAMLWERFNSGFRMISCGLLAGFAVLGLFLFSRTSGRDWAAFLQPIWWLSCCVMIAFGVAALVFVRQRHSRAALLALAAAVIPLAFNLMDAHARRASTNTLREMADNLDFGGKGRGPIWLDEDTSAVSSLLFYAPADLQLNRSVEESTTPSASTIYLVCPTKKTGLWLAQHPTRRVVCKTPMQSLIQLR